MDERNGNDHKAQVEHDLVQALTEGEMDKLDPDEAAVDRISPRYEMRVQAERDPIVEETNIIRGMAREVDDRYDAYMARAARQDKREDDEV